MIETNIQQQQDSVSKQPALHDAGLVAETGMTVTCALCDAVYAPSPQQGPFLQYTQGALEATFMSMCHFCFRCRRAACPQCWDSVHGVCGACVQDASLPFRSEATPLDGLAFPPTSQPSSPLSQQQQNTSLFVLIRSGRFSIEAHVRREQAAPDLDTGPVVQPVAAQAIIPDNTVRESEQSVTPVTVAIPTKTPLPEVPIDDTRKQEKTPRIASKAKKASRLELAFTWVVLIIVLALVGVIALAEYVPAVNTLVIRVTHIDIHTEIAYLVHMAQQLFKR